MRERKIGNKEGRNVEARNGERGGGKKMGYIVGSYHVVKLFGYRRFFDVQTVGKSG